MIYKLEKKYMFKNKDIRNPNANKCLIFAGVIQQ